MHTARFRAATALAPGSEVTASYGYDLTGAAANMTFGYNPAGQIVSRTGSNDAYA